MLPPREKHLERVFTVCLHRAFTRELTRRTGQAEGGEGQKLEYDKATSEYRNHKES